MENLAGIAPDVLWFPHFGKCEDFFSYNRKANEPYCESECLWIYVGNPLIIYIKKRYDLFSNLRFVDRFSSSEIFSLIWSKWSFFTGRKIILDSIYVVFCTNIKWNVINFNHCWYSYFMIIYFERLYDKISIINSNDLMKSHSFSKFWFNVRHHITFYIWKGLFRLALLKIILVYHHTTFSTNHMKRFKKKQTRGFSDMKYWTISDNSHQCTNTVHRRYLILTTRNNERKWIVCVCFVGGKKGVNAVNLI